MRFKRKILFAIFITFVACAVSARNGNAEPLSLQDCMDIALANSSSVKISGYSVSQAREKADGSFARLLPKMTGRASYLRYDSVPTVDIPGFGTLPMGTRDNISYSVELTQPLFTGGRLKSDYSTANTAYDSAKMELDIAKKDILREVTEKYFQVLKTNKLVEIAKSSKSIIGAHLKNVQSFYDAGAASKNDLLSATVSLANAENFLISAINGSELAKSSLNFTLGRDVNIPVDLEDIGKDVKPFETALDECTRQAFFNRDELKIIGNAKSMSESAIDMQKSAHYPQFYLIGSYTESGDELPLRDKYYSALFTMELNIFDWGETSSNVEGSRIELKKIYESETLLRNAISLEVKAAYLRLKQSEEAIRATSQAVEQAQENYRIYEAKFNVSAATSTEVLDAEDLLLRSKINYFQALYDFHIAKVNLQRAMGA